MDNIYNYDPQLVVAVKDELREKLNLQVGIYSAGVVRVWLTRSDQFVNIVFKNDFMTLHHTALPNGNHVDSQSFSIGDPETDPIREICRYVDRASKFVAEYEKSTKQSKEMLEQLL